MTERALSCLACGGSKARLTTGAEVKRLGYWRNFDVRNGLG